MLSKIKYGCSWDGCREDATYRWYRSVNGGFIHLCDDHLKTIEQIHIDNHYEELEDAWKTRIDKKKRLLDELNGV